jgi:hypothetical protein
LKHHFVAGVFYNKQLPFENPGNNEIRTLRTTTLASLKRNRVYCEQPASGFDVSSTISRDSCLVGRHSTPVGSEEAAVDVYGGERSGGPLGGTDSDGLIDPCSSRMEVPLPCGVGVLPVIIRAG